MTDKQLALQRRRLFHFGRARFHVSLHRGKRGRWTWQVHDAERGGKTRLLTPPRGMETEAEAEADALTFFTELGLHVTNV